MVSSDATFAKIQKNDDAGATMAKRKIKCYVALVIPLWTWYGGARDWLRNRSATLAFILKNRNTTTLDFVAQ